MAKWKRGIVTLNTPILYAELSVLINDINSYQMDDETFLSYSKLQNRSFHQNDSY